MSDGEVPEGRCGFVQEPGDFPEQAQKTWLDALVPFKPVQDYDAGSDEWYEASEAVGCWREVWDGADDGRCVWHAKSDDKPARALVETRSERHERLDGAYIPAVDLGDAIDFEECGLQAATFDGTGLQEASFAGVDGLVAQFPDADLSHAEFSDANLWGAQFPDAGLAGAQFPDANLWDAQFPDATLWDAQFLHADLRGAQFSEADLRDAEFSEADLRRAQFLEVDLQHAEFSDANLGGAQFLEVDLHFAQFPHADLQDAQFPDANLFVAQFPDADLTGAQFPDADLTGAQFPNAGLRDAQFPDATLWVAQFLHADLRGAQFSEADLRDAEFSEADLRRARLPDADLTNANLTDADATDATFTGATLEHATLTRTDLGGADLTDARLHDAHWLDARINEGTTFGDITPDEARATRLTPPHVRPYLRRAATTAGAVADQLDYDARHRPTTRPIHRRVRARLATLPVVQRLHKKLRPKYEAARRWWFWYRTDRDALDLPHDDLGKANTVYRTIQRLYRENSMPRRIDTYHVRARDTRRKQAIIDGDLGRWLYLAGQRWVMGYGERPWRVVGTSVGVMAASALGYLVAGPFARTPAPEDATIVGGHLLAAVPVTLPGWLAEVLTSLYFSVVTFTTLGYGDLQPASGVAQTIATVESFVGALLMALLVFVLGRRTGR